LSEPPRAVLDADIIFSRVLHELLGRVATAGFCDLIWSRELVAEARASLIARKGPSEQAAQIWVGHLQREFPLGGVPCRWESISPR
jgi:hypothetical protein